MTNVISINSHARRFPPGSFAMHRIHGWCEIVGAQDTRRTIRWQTFEPDATPDATDLPTDVLPEEVLMSETISVCVDEVDADELTAIDTAHPALDQEAKGHLTFVMGLLD